MPRRPQKKIAVPVAPAFKIIHTSKCQTLSNKSTLTYNLSKDDKDKIYIRINNNTGGGFFSNEWILLDSITGIISVASDMTSTILIPLFKGKSVNTPSFLLAALLNEGMVSPCPEDKRRYVYSGTEKLQKIIDKKQGAK